MTAVAVQHVLQARGITKRFGHVTALSNVSPTTCPRRGTFIVDRKYLTRGRSRRWASPRRGTFSI